MIQISGGAFQRDILFAFGGGNPAITIAVLDGPVDRTHDCFVGARLAPLATAAAGRCRDGNATEHGTHLASLIFGQPCSSVEGVAPLCRGLIAPIFGDDLQGCPQFELAEAIGSTLNYGAHVVLISGGLFHRRRQPETALVEAVAACNTRNVLIVAGGGRDGIAGLLRMAGAAHLLPVGATDRRGRMLGGGEPGLHENGITAPGSGLIGATMQGRVGQRNGANSSAALIAGIAGLLLGAEHDRDGARDPADVIAAMLNSATPRMARRALECQRAFVGRDNIRAAASYLDNGIDDPFASPLLENWLGTSLHPTRSGQAAFRPRA
jgi:subtilisin family serine protease